MDLVTKLMIHRIATIDWFVSNFPELPHRTIVRSEFVGMSLPTSPIRVLGTW